MAALASTALTPLALAADFPAAIDLASLDGTIGFRLDGIDQSDSAGKSVASGDVNGDGFADIIIGAPFADPPDRGTAGETYVVFGKGTPFAAAIGLGSLTPATGFRLDGVADDDASGYDVASAGDVNGDGFDDIIINSPNGTQGGVVDAGENYVIFGKRTGFGSVFELSSLNGANGFRLDGIDIGDYAGFGVASAGDVNGDGFDEVLIGAHDADPDGVSGAGESYVVFGKTSFAPAIGLGSATGAAGFRLEGVNLEDYSGFAVASAGDVNGDGFDDVVVSAINANLGNAENVGQTYVVFGKAGGFVTPVELGALNGTNGFKMNGAAEDDQAGRAVASAGDVNGDGFGDVIVAAWPADTQTGGADAGSTYVVFGKGSFAGTPTINLALLNGGNGFRLDGVDASDFSGYSAASAGDVNGDGFGDLVIGAPRADPGGDSAAGEAYVVFGKAHFSGVFDLELLNGANGFRLDGVDPGTFVGDLVGKAVAEGGDVNGDGFDDVIVGAQGANSYAGETYVVFGRPPSAAVTRNGTPADQYMSGGTFVDTLRGAAGDDVLEGRAQGDALNGGPGSDTASYRHAAGAVTANLGNPGVNAGEADNDSYVSVENLEGSAFGDVLVGNASANTLTGNGAQDRLTGGGGPDIFKFDEIADSPAGPTTRDRVADFNPGTSTTFVDRIDLTEIDARTGPGDQAFTYIGTAPFSDVKGQLRVRQAMDGSAIIQGDVNGDSVADIEITLLNFTNLAALTALDFKR